MAFGQWEVVQFCGITQRKLDARAEVSFKGSNGKPSILGR